MSTPIQLTILRQGDTNLVDLAEVGSLIPRSETWVDDGFLNELANEVSALARGSRSRGTAVVRDLERMGSLVFSHLLTEAARRRLRDADPADLHLRLDEKLVHVPWELCHDGRDFLATKFRVGRQVITAQPIPEPRATRRRRTALRVLLVADPTETLPQVAAEAEQLCALLDAVPGVDVTLLGGKDVRRIPLLAALGEHDVVHFAGHSHYDPEAPARSGWRLHDGVLTAGELSKLRPPPWLVFSNSCEAAASKAWDGRYRFEGNAFGIGSAFLLAGVQNYIGTFWVVHDAESMLIATTCYRALAAGASLGAALHEARQAVIAEWGWDGLTWASYLLYGDPTFVPLPLEGERAVEASLRPPPASVAPRRAHEVHRFDVDLELGRGGRPNVKPVSAGPALMVGRADELRRLGEALDAVCRGARRTVIVSGPAGIGKTALLDEFVAQAGAAGDVWIAHGQSIQQYGVGEAYLPVLEAWGRLERSWGGPGLVAALRRHAPTWLAQFPHLLDEIDPGSFDPRTQTASRERMLREMAELLEAVTADRPGVLVLEDLHWSDHSTLDLIAYVAQRREAARLLLVGTFRSAENMDHDHPLRAITRELQARGRAEEIHLAPLRERDVAEYLRGRLADDAIEDDLARLFHRRTDGHPLFLANVVAFALREGLIVRHEGHWRLPGGFAALGSGVPEDLRQMIERQVEALTPDERQVLEAASVCGAEFSTAAVAAALLRPIEESEERCESLAWKGQFLREAGVEEWPDGTIAGRYAFTHALYVDVLYGRVAPARRLRLHRRIGERKEVAFATRPAEAAAELAVHFEAARDTRRAIAYHEQAGDVALARHAGHEAVEQLNACRRLVTELPDGPDRTQLEMTLLMKLAAPLMSIKGWAARELEEVLVRAHALSRRVDEEPHLFPLLRGLVSFYQVRGEAPMARAFGEEMLALCARVPDPLAPVQAHYGQGVTLHGLAELEAAEVHLRRALALYDPATHRAHVQTYGDYDPGVSCRCWLAWLQWFRGSPDSALRTVREAVEQASGLTHPFTLNWAHLSAAIIHLYRGEAAPALEHLTTANAIARDEGFENQLASGAAVGGWARLVDGRRQEAIVLLRDALARYRETGAQVWLPMVLAMLGVAEATSGDLDAGLRHLDEGIEVAERTTQRLLLPELYRARGNLLAGSDPARADEAAAVLERASALAQASGARMQMLQAATSLWRLRSRQGRTDEARVLLEPVYASFTEGLDLAELREAKALLDRG